MAKAITHREKSARPPYGPVRSPQALGRLARQERKLQGLTLDQVYSASGLSTRFLSEFERGKPNASLGRVMDALQALGLEMLVLPRGEAERVLAARHPRGNDGGTLGGAGK
jgi:transcriptional regulator with XRE-family HTH domain